MRIDLGPEEATLLRELLRNELSDLRMETAGTDSADYRAMLHQRQAMMQRILDLLGGDPAVVEPEDRPAERRPDLGAR